MAIQVHGTQAVSNLTRITVQGSANTPEWGDAFTGARTRCAFVQDPYSPDIERPVDAAKRVTTLYTQPVMTFRRQFSVNPIPPKLHRHEFMGSVMPSKPNPILFYNDLTL